MPQGKHDAIKPLAQTKLDSTANRISQAPQEGEITFFAFHNILKVVENVANLKLVSETNLKRR